MHLPFSLTVPSSGLFEHREFPVLEYWNPATTATRTVGLGMDV